MNRMRSFRHTLIIIICVSLVAFCGWWVTWPKRTIKEFVQSLRTNEFDIALRMMETQEDRELVETMKDMHDLNPQSTRPHDDGAAGEIQFKQDERSFSDILLGRAFFYRLDSGFYVQRGRVSFEPFVKNP